MRVAVAWLSPASPSTQKKYTGKSFKFGKVPNPSFEKFQVYEGCCGVAVTGISQPSEKSIPAIVLNLERSLTHILRNFKLILVSAKWMPPASHSLQKKYTGNSFKI